MRYHLREKCKTTARISGHYESGVVACPYRIAMFAMLLCLSLSVACTSTGVELTDWVDIDLTAEQSEARVTLQEKGQTIQYSETHVTLRWVKKPALSGRTIQYEVLRRSQGEEGFTSREFLGPMPNPGARSVSYHLYYSYSESIEPGTVYVYKIRVISEGIDLLSEGVEIVVGATPERQ